MCAPYCSDPQQNREQEQDIIEPSQPTRRGREHKFHQTALHLRNPGERNREEVEEALPGIGTICDNWLFMGALLCKPITFRSSVYRKQELGWGDESKMSWKDRNLCKCQEVRIVHKVHGWGDGAERNMIT